MKCLSPANTASIANQCEVADDSYIPLSGTYHTEYPPPQVPINIYDIISLY